MKRFLYAFAALLCFAACTKELPVVTIYAVQTFNSENVAAATIKLSAASKNDIQVLLEGTPADKLSFRDVVDIPAGETAVGCMIRINPEGIDPNAPIQVFIKDAIGAKVGAPAMVTIGLSSSYSGNGGNGEENGDNGGQGGDVTATLVSTWTAAMDGEPYTDEYGDWIDLTISTPGIKYYSVEGLTNADYAEYYSSIDEFIQDVQYYIDGYLEEYEISDVLFADGEYSYIEYPGEGAGKIYIVEFDENGKATGRYGVSDATFPAFEGSGGGDVPEATLMSTWTATMDGEPYTDEYGDWIDLTVSTPGIKYYGVEGVLDEDFDYYYESVDEYIADWDSYITAQLEDYELTDILFANGEYTYIDYPGEGAGKIFIVEFDADGRATGRYGVSSAVFPEFEGSGGGDGPAELDKTTVGVPDTFTRNTSLGLDYLGRTTYSGTDLEVYSATGVGDAMWYSEINELDFFKDEDVHDLAEELAEYIEDGLAEVMDELGDYFGYFYDSFADFLASELLGVGEDEPMGFPVLGEGDFSAIIFTFTEDGDMTGEYNIVTVAADGHEYVVPEAAPAPHRLMARTTRPHRKLQKMNRPDIKAERARKIAGRGFTQNR